MGETCEREISGFTCSSFDNRWFKRNVFPLPFLVKFRFVAIIMNLMSNCQYIEFLMIISFLYFISLISLIGECTEER